MMHVIAGFGRSGRSVAGALGRMKIPFAVYDDSSTARSEARAKGLEVIEGIDEVCRAEHLVVSPGIHPHHELLRKCRHRTIHVITEVEWARDLLEGTFLAITGTNGKSTTVMLLAHILKNAGIRSVPAGNIGQPLADFVAADSQPDCYVLELSSFQLTHIESLPLTGAAILNITPDHLDWHGGFDHYRKTKLKILSLVEQDGFRIAPEQHAPENSILFGYGEHCDLRITPSRLFYRNQPFLNREDCPLPGEHNWQNVACVSLCVLSLGLPADAVNEGLRSFSPLPHRMETVGRYNGVTYINDSKATNVESTRYALTSFSQPSVWLILGGRGKGTGYSGLRDPIGNVCRGVLTIGEEGPVIARDLNGCHAPVTIKETLKEAILFIREQAVSGDVVLLSPACSSFDQYANFEERGEHFRTLVNSCRE